MRIGISGYVGNRLTGIGRVLVNILKELAILYPEDTFVLFKNYDTDFYTELSKYNNIDIINYNVSKESGLKNIIWHQWGFQKLIKKHNCDIAYIPNFSLLIWKKVPTVVTIHDLIEYNVPDKFSKLRTIYRKFADPLLAKRSDFILTVSESSKRDIVKFLNTKENKILVTPNAVDKNKFYPLRKEEVQECISKYNLKYKEYLLFVGTIDYPGKNIKTVIDAFLALKESYDISQKLVIVGKDGFNSKVIYDAVNSSPYKNDVIFTGYIEDEILHKLLCGAEIMTYLSLYEGFGLPVLEAMSCGTAVICSNTSCFPEIVEGLDITCTPTDTEMVKKKILRIISDESYRHELENECLKKSNQYNWTESAKLYGKTFHRFEKKEKSK